MCTYQVSMPENAGPGDVMTLEFLYAEATGVGYGIGTNYTTAEGFKLEGDPSGKSITAAYPFSVYLTMFNTDSPGKFTI